MSPPVVCCVPFRLKAALTNDAGPPTVKTPVPGRALLVNTSSVPDKTVVPPV